MLSVPITNQLGSQLHVNMLKDMVIFVKIKMTVIIDYYRIFPTMRKSYATCGWEMGPNLNISQVNIFTGNRSSVSRLGMKGALSKGSVFHKQEWGKVHHSVKHMIV